jgi:hypothetical protein
MVDRRSPIVTGSGGRRSRVLIAGLAQWVVDLNTRRMILVDNPTG